MSCFSALLVSLKSGDRMEDAFQAAGSKKLILTAYSGKELRILINAVGAGIGAAAGVAYGLAIGQSFEETVLARSDILGAAFGGIGALVGTLTGPALAKPQGGILYQAVD